MVNTKQPRGEFTQPRGQFQHVVFANLSCRGRLALVHLREDVFDLVMHDQIQLSQIRTFRRDEFHIFADLVAFLRVLAQGEIIVDSLGDFGAEFLHLSADVLVLDRFGHKADVRLGEEISVCRVAAMDKRDHLLTSEPRGKQRGKITCNHVDKHLPT